MTSIDLGACFEISDATLLELQNHPNLNSISLMSCSRVTDNAIRTLANSCNELKWVNLSWCKQFTDYALDDLVAKCPKLVSIDVSQCDNISPVALKTLRDASPTLEIIN